MKSVQLTKSPELLFLHLKRFRTYQKEDKFFRERIDTTVNFKTEKPFKFTKVFAKAISAPTLVDPEKYEIRGVVQHKNSNSTGSGGHFTCVLYDWEAKEWWRFDDSRVNEVKDIAEVFKDSYILVY